MASQRKLSLPRRESSEISKDTKVPSADAGSKESASGEKISSGLGIEPGKKVIERKPPRIVRIGSRRKKH